MRSINTLPLFLRDRHFERDTNGLLACAATESATVRLWMYSRLTPMSRRFWSTMLETYWSHTFERVNALL